MTDHMSFLEPIARDDVAGLDAAERQYAGSWKKRGGVGAFMMLARKWDRIVQALSPPVVTISNDRALHLANKAANLVGMGAQDQFDSEELSDIGVALRERGSHGYDIFAAAEADERPEGLIDDIRDLRRYLLLVEAELRAREVASAMTVHRDNQGETNAPHDRR